MPSVKSPKKNKARPVEWIAGRATMPAYVTGEGEPYRPEMLIWMSAEGMVLGCDTGRPGELLPQAATLLRRVSARPLVGRPHVPQRIRVASDDLAAALRGAIPGVEIARAPTPELDALLDSMRESMSQGGARAETYLTPGIDAAALAAFFRAAATFHRAAPWSAVPANEALAVHIEALGVRRAAVTLAGQSGTAYGYMIFDDVASFHEFIEAAEDPDDDLPAAMPPHLAVHLGRAADLPDGLAAEMARHGWEVAGPDAIPWPVALDEELIPRPMTAAELLIAEAVALAVAELVTSTRDLENAWRGGDSITRTIQVGTHRGPIAVTLGAPAETFTTSSAVPPFGLVDDLAALEGEGDELDVEEANDLSDRLVLEFLASPEGQSPPGAASWCGVVMHLGAGHLGVTIASIGPDHLAEILFELFPRQVSVSPSEAPSIVDELRAFYAFLVRAHGLTVAPACLRALGPSTATRLAAALGDRSRFGMAKAVLAMADERGFDMESKEGVEAFMRSIEGQPLPASIRLPGAPAAAVGPRPRAAGKAGRTKGRKATARRAPSKKR